MVDKTGREIVDPTGRAHKIHPSKETVLKDWKFGLGTSSPALVEKMQQRHPDVRVDDRAVPKLENLLTGTYVGLHS